MTSERCLSSSQETFRRVRLLEPFEFESWQLASITGQRCAKKKKEKLKN